MTSQSVQPIQIPTSWAEFTETVLALYEDPIRRKATRIKIHQVLGEFEAVGCQTTADLTVVRIARWIKAHPDRRPSTVDALLRSLRAAVVIGRKMGLVPLDPFTIRAPSQWVDWDCEEIDPPVHTAEEIARVFRVIDREAASGDWRSGRLQALVYAYAYTGARKREILGLRRDDIELSTRVLRIKSNPRRKLKTPKSGGRLAIAEPLAEVLETWLPRTGCEWAFPGATRVGPWFGGPPGYRPLDQVKRLGQRSGVPGLTLQSFRHTFATLSEGWGIGELSLQRILRHTNPKTQKSYRHELVEQLHREAEKVRYA